MDRKQQPPPQLKRRTWTFRIAALLFPFLLLGVLELAFRIAGAYEDRSFRNPYVAYEESYRYFPRWEETLATPKPPGVFRIFALGGSTTMGFRVEHSFTEQLQGILCVRKPEVAWEVVNAGVLSMGSHRVYEVMREALRFEPDLYIVCMGNNEFLEEVSVTSDGLTGLGQRIGRFARKLRVVNFGRHVLGVGESRPDSVLGEHVAREPEFPLIHSKEQYEARLLFLEANVGLMIDFARAHGVRIAFVPTAPNLLCAPGNPVHGSGFAENEARWNELWARGRAEYDAGRWDAAIATIRTLIEIDDRHAGAHYELGISLLGDRRTAEARQALLLANLNDRAGAHANSDVIDAILDTCRERGAETVDVRGAFDEFLQSDYDRFFLRDEPLALFLDHCHPTEIGHQIIARALADLLSADD